jgi:hypothetical protein
MGSPISGAMATATPLTIVALKPKARMCVFGYFYLTVFFKLLVFCRIARARIIFQILNSLLLTPVLTMEGI